MEEWNWREWTGGFGPRAAAFGCAGEDSVASPGCGTASLRGFEGQPSCFPKDRVDGSSRDPIESFWGNSYDAQSGTN